MILSLLFIILRVLWVSWTCGLMYLFFGKIVTVVLSNISSVLFPFAQRLSLVSYLVSVFLMRIWWELCEKNLEVGLNTLVIEALKNPVFLL